MDIKTLCADRWGIETQGILPLTEQASRLYSADGDFLFFRGSGANFISCLDLQAACMEAEPILTLSGERFTTVEDASCCLFPAPRMNQVPDAELIDPLVVLTLIRSARELAVSFAAPAEPNLLRRMERAFHDMVAFAETAGQRAGDTAFLRYVESALQAAVKARALLPEPDYLRYAEDPGNHTLCLRDLRPLNFYMDKDGQLRFLSCFSAAPGLVGDDVAKLILTYAPGSLPLSEKLLRAAGLRDDALRAVLAEILFPWDFWSAGYRCLAGDSETPAALTELHARTQMVEDLTAIFLPKAETALPIPEPPAPQPAPTAEKPEDKAAPLTWTFPLGR